MDERDLDNQLLHVRRSAWHGKVQTPKSKTTEPSCPSAPL